MPATAALILIYREKGGAGIIVLFKRAFDWRKIHPKIWFMPIILMIPSIGLVNYIFAKITQDSVPPLHFSWPILLGYCTVFFMTYAEELGLTGYAIDRLQPKFSALRSGILLGVLWAGYHIPGFIISGYYTWVWIFWHAIYTVAARVLCVWIYNNAGKSLFSMALFHWAFGLFWIFLPQTGNLQKASVYYDPRLSAIMCILYAVVVTYFWGASTLAKFRLSRK